MKEKGPLRVERGSLSRIYVSLNHGIFLCSNCARIHQENYGVEVSFVKPVLDLQDGRLQGAEGPDSWKSAQAKWSNMQLRVLLLTGGNEQFADYMN